MATFSITKIHLEWAVGSAHVHIGRVQLLGQTRDYSRAEIITAIYAGDVFVTNAVPAARVVVRNCPVCAAGDYITTEPDWTAKNNLLDLPTY